MASSRRLPVDYNESTYASSGADYTSLATWESDTDIDLVTATKGEVLTCASGVYNDCLPIATKLEGAITSSDYFRIVRGAVGTASPTSGARFEIIVTENVSAFVVAEEYSGLYDIAVKITSSTANIQVIAFYIYYTSAGYNKIVGCVAYDCASSNATPGGAYGFFVYRTGLPTYFINCVALNISGSTGTNNSSAFKLTSNSAQGNETAYIYNCTINNSNNDGILCIQQSASCIVYLKNTVMENIDGSNTRNGTVYQTTNELEQGVTFAVDGFHLSSADTVAIGEGTDLSGDGVYAFDDDIDGDTRDDWDVGADEYILQSRGYSQSIILI